MIRVHAEAVKNISSVVEENNKRKRGDASGRIRPDEI